jgi:alpha-amylase/alpha-mannosidase (GH57 family)
MERYICIHGHFYQPPRENPWLETVEIEDSAYPYHDWNERVDAECYGPNAASRIVGPDGYILDIVNNYSKMSFNFGPTLLAWMEKAAPETYQGILEADQLSADRFSGHGSAIAQVYNHVIMPLASSRDKRTQVIWGIRDFRRRFRREPEGMWLPETAVDLETLDLLTEYGIKFTILSPIQVKSVRSIGAPGWHDVSGGRIDPSRAYWCLLPSNRRIALFFYDGPISQAVAFERLLVSGEIFAHRLTTGFNDARHHDQIVHVATDGETYGHHFRYGDMSLAYSLYYLESNNLARITNYGEYLERHPPAHEVEIFENSSWSCVHGVERWRENCGCNSGTHPGWHQAWRRPLRQAFDMIRDRCLQIFEEEGAKYLADPWKARDEYIDVINDRSDANVSAFLSRHAGRELPDSEKEQVLKLLAMQRAAMLMYTSCGWFFDEISGIETVQVMKYACRAIQLAEDVRPGPGLEREFLERLSAAPSNVFENGAKVYETLVKPARVEILRVAAHYVISSLFFDYPKESKAIYSYKVEDIAYERLIVGPGRLAVGRCLLRSNLSGEKADAIFAAFHFGDVGLAAGVYHFTDEESFRRMCAEVRGAFESGDVAETIRAIDRHFVAPYNYTLWHLFKDEQRRVIKMVLKDKYEQVEDLFRTIYEGSYWMMAFLKSVNNPVPKPFYSATEATINLGLWRIFNGEFDIERLAHLVKEAEAWPVSVDRDGLRLWAGQWIDEEMKKLAKKPQDPESVLLLEKIRDAIQILAGLSLSLNLWRAQNIYFKMRRAVFGTTWERARTGDYETRKWVLAFNDLGEQLGIKVKESE